MIGCWCRQEISEFTSPKQGEQNRRCIQEICDFENNPHIQSHNFFLAEHNKHLNITKERSVRYDSILHDKGDPNLQVRCIL